MPPLRREGGPEDEPQARRPAGSLTVCLPRGGWPQARISWSPIPRCEGSGFVFCRPTFLRMLAAFELGGSSCGFPDLIVSTVIATALFAPIARAQTPASASSPAANSNRAVIAEKESESAGDTCQKRRGAKTEPGGRHRDANPAAQSARSVRRSRSSKTRRSRIRRSNASRTCCDKCPACRSRRAARPARSTTCRFAARPRRRRWCSVERGRSQRGRDGQLRPGEPDYGTTWIASRFLRGAGGSLYGSQAIGGVVNVLSQEGDGPPTASLLSGGGNCATARQVREPVSGAEGNLHYSGAVSYFSTKAIARSTTTPTTSR